MWVRADIHADRDDRDRVIQWFVILTDITRERGTRAALNQLNAKLEQKVAERTVLAENRARQLQKLTVKLIEAEERERRRVTELLHNDLQQILAYGRLQFQLSGLELKDFTGPDKVDRILAKAIDKARRFSHGLSPKKLDGHSLFQSLQWLARQMDEQFGLKVRLIENSRHEFVHRHLKIFIFRSVQELLFNVYKHAGVKEADVSISASDTAIRVKVSDQDPGFARIEKNLKDTPDGFGLMSIRERALAIGAEFTINSAPGKGSRIELTIPIGILKTHPKEQEGETKQPISSVVLDE